MKRLSPTDWWNTILRHFANASIAHESSAHSVAAGDALAVVAFRRLLRAELQEARRCTKAAPRGWHDVAYAVSDIARDVEALSLAIERATTEKEAQEIAAALQLQDARLDDAWRAAMRLSRRGRVGLMSPAQMAEIVRNATAEVA